MKTMTCNQIAGACDEKFQAETFEEIAEQSKLHAMEMAQKGDQAHIKKMEEMKVMMSKPGAFDEWHQEVRKVFDELPEE